MKLDRKYPKHKLPMWVNGGGLLIRGAAPSTSYNSNRWEFLDEKEMKRLLGYSLGDLYPQQWPLLPENDLYD